jgi:predicted transposase/invertase (TIGR01784 family)
LHGNAAVARLDIVCDGPIFTPFGASYAPQRKERFMILGIDPKVDYAFKHLLGRDATRPILIDVIDNVLNPLPGHHIRDIELMNPFNPKEALDDKLSILDIKARDQSGRQLNLEMQMLASIAYDKRILYYWAKLHQQQLHQGADYLTLRPTISISFLNHVMFPNVPDYHLWFRLLERTHEFALSEDVEFHILELPKFKKSAAELATGLDFWLYFLRHAETMDTEALPTCLQQQPLVLRAVEELKMLSQSDVERERYEARRKAQLDYNTGMKGARLEGRQEGRLEGRVEGEKIGTIRLCERLLNRPQTPTEQLAGLSLEELTRLADDMQKQVEKR